PPLDPASNQWHPYLDLVLQSLEEMSANLLSMVMTEGGLSQEQVEAQDKALKEQLDRLQKAAKERSDDYFTRTQQPTITFRGRLAWLHGPVKEVWTARREAEPQELVKEGLTPGGVRLGLCAGGAAPARALPTGAYRPATQLPPQFQHLALLSAAIVGDYDAADG